MNLIGLSISVILPSHRSFSSAWKKTNQKKTPLSRVTLRVAQPVDEAAPHAAMRCYPSCSGAHNLAIVARLTSISALPASMMLAASTCLSGRSTRKLTRLAAGSDSPRAISRPPHRCSARVKGRSKRHYGVIPPIRRGDTYNLLLSERNGRYSEGGAKSAASSITA